MSIFDGSANPAVPGTVVPGNMPSRPSEYAFKRDWYIDQLFDPDIHDVTDVWQKYIVPYEGELIKDTKNKKLYIVSHVDVSTWKSTLVPFEFESVAGETELYPLYPDHEYGMLQAEFPLFLDYTVVPPVARVSSMAYQTNPAYALLYYGGFNKENIISAIYSNKGFEKNEIPCVTVVPPGFNIENDIIKSTDTFSVILPKETLKNGARCTLVYYTQDGEPLSPTYSLMVQHSEYLRDHKLANRYVKSIELVSPWFTNSLTPQTLYVPVNLMLVSIVFMAKITYSDGTSDTVPVNGYDGVSGFTLHGIDTFKPTAPNQKGSMVLSYKFEEGEEAAIAQPGQPDHMSVEYEIVAVAVDGAYTPRLYIYPYWTASGFKLKFFLGDLTRKFMIDVSAFVKLNRNSPAFSGTAYGVEQTLTFNLNLSEVSFAFNNWTFTQTVVITLYNEGTSSLRKWDIQNSTMLPAFENLEILYIPQVDGTQRAKFNGFTTVDNFLARAYYGIDPSYSNLREEGPLVPTHMKLIRENGESVTVPVGSFNNLAMNQFTMNNAETFFIAWIKSDGSGNDLQLGLSAAITRKVTTF